MYLKANYQLNIFFFIGNSMKLDTVIVINVLTHHIDTSTLGFAFF